MTISSQLRARGRVVRVERDRVAVRVRDAELGRQALGVPRLPPEEDVLAARVPLRDPGRGGRATSPRPARCRRRSPATCRRGRSCRGRGRAPRGARGSRRSAPASRSRARARPRRARGGTARPSRRRSARATTPATRAAAAPAPHRARSRSSRWRRSPAYGSGTCGVTTSVGVANSPSTLVWPS